MIKDMMNKHIHFSQGRLLKKFLTRRDYALKASMRPLHSYLGKWLPRKPGAKVLELGCGPGKYVALLSTLGYRVVGVDPFSFPTWNLIRQRTSAVFLEGICAENLPFQNKSFDYGVCLGALLYFDDPKKGLREFVRVIKPGGTVILRTVNRKNLYTARTGKRIDPASKHLYTMEELLDLVRATGLLVQENLSFGFFPPFWTVFWWYLMCCWLPDWSQRFLSNTLSPESRVNHIVLAKIPVG